MKRLCYYILGIIFLLVSCKEKTAEGIVPQDRIPVQLTPLTRDTVSTSFKSSGYFTTDNETPLSFKNGGIIDHIYVHEGDTIKAGQLLATVKGVETKSATRQAALNYKKAKRDYKRALHLYKDSVATLEGMQNARTALAVAQQQKHAAEFNEGQTEIRAASSGYVLKQYLQKGEMAAPGAPVLLVNSTTNTSWIFKTNLNDVQWAELKVGDSATVSTDFKRNERLNAQVFRKNKGVDPEIGGFTVQLKINNAQQVPLASGLFGKATLYPSQKRIAWRIPFNALLDGDADQGFVFITNDKTHAEKISVHIAAVHHNYVLIDRGLEEAKYLIISGSAYLNDGVNIEIREDK